jgi:hypothetical protein
VIAYLTAWTLLIKRVENQQLQLHVLALALALVLRIDSFEGSNSFSIPCSPLLSRATGTGGFGSDSHLSQLLDLYLSHEDDDEDPSSMEEKMTMTSMS